MARPKRMRSFWAYAIYKVYYTTMVYQYSSIRTWINDYSYKLLFENTKLCIHKQINVHSQITTFMDVQNSTPIPPSNTTLLQSKVRPMDHMGGTHQGKAQKQVQVPVLHAYPTGSSPI